MSDFEDFALSFMRGSRGKTMGRGRLVGELVALSQHSGGAWPKGREPEWSKAISELVAKGKLAEDDAGVRFVVEPVEAPAAKVAQGELF